MKRGKLYNTHFDEPTKLEEIRKTALKFKNDGNKLHVNKEYSKAEEQYWLGLEASSYVVLDGVEFDIANNLAQNLIV